ncbi:DUF6364 family protein [Thermodesulfovibrio yellowstonii]|uniref:CopG family transcriptional regulator n=1 Tax=Thermodesulfovibrio yellowstonii TaxID=28262 RepID=A0A9W6GH84_9BACT|nr:DUF6364 family protein [Thermodesulfovibrio islandicus]GLI53846.1 CopG family transcriptional regulator [Thermodesulfovibrio islandicus]
MEKQNITLSLPKDLLKKAKSIAIREDKSLSQLIREVLEERIRKTEDYNKAMQRQLKILRKGFNLGTEGNISIKRTELHDR